jgi:Aldo/keto reductase family
MMMIPMAKLNNGALLPLLGLGTLRSAPGVVKEAVVTAIQAGYRHIDCAHVYGNEREIGEALSECISSGICARQELFVTSKLWNDSHEKEEVRPALLHTLEQLQLDYLDMYLSTSMQRRLVLPWHYCLSEKALTMSLPLVACFPTSVPFRPTQQFTGPLLPKGRPAMSRQSSIAWKNVLSQRHGKEWRSVWRLALQRALA